MMEAAVEHLVNEILALEETPGASIAVIVDGQSWSTAVGSRDLDGSFPLEPDARFPIYSITKTFIATAVLRLVESGNLVLDESVRAILPGISLDPAITLCQILSHTAGLPDYGRMPAYSEDLKRSPGSPWTPTQFLDNTLSRGMLFAPGQGWAYSNIGYLILKLVLEHTTGIPLRDALDTLVITPAGLDCTFVVETLEDSAAITPGFSTQLNADSRDATLHDISRLYHPGWVSHGLIVSTAMDVARFLKALMRGRLLGQPLLTQMLAPNPVPYPHHLFANPSYGLGLMLDRGSRHGTITGHAGGGPGYSTAVLHLPNASGHALTVSAFVNRDHDDTGLKLAWMLAMNLSDRMAQASHTSQF